jgi:hypothetical protein
MEDSMKKILTLFAAMIMTAFLASAQDTSMSGSTGTETKANSNPISLQGCLSGSNGAYNLTDKQTGMVFSLTGKSDTLGQHVGHEVEVTGQKSTTASNDSAMNNSADSSSTGTSSTANPNGRADSVTFQVDDVRMISDHCHATGANNR